MIHSPAKWSIPSSLSACTSADVSGVTNYFRSNDSSNQHQLKCVSSSDDHAIYIYGISEEIDISVEGGDDDSLPL